VGGEVRWYKTQVAWVLAALVLAFLIALSLLYPLAHYCSPHSFEYANALAQHRSTDHVDAGGDLSPFEKTVTAIYLAIQSQLQTAPQKREGWWHSFACDMKVTDFAIATFTLWLVVIGAWQGFQLQRTVEATNRAADALPKIERAYLFAHQFSGSVGPSTTTRREDGQQVTMVHLRIGINFQNHGRTPAVIRDTVAAVKVCKTFAEATLADADAIKPAFFPRGWVIGSGEVRSTDLLDFEIAADKYNKACGAEEGMIVVFGVVEYEDVLSETRTLRFMSEFRAQRAEAYRFPANGEGNSWT
jgi:hypothetical protein